eukprot:Colp12_sorted_trinity150504_noHs@3137
MGELKVKICLIGPSKVGKTVIANFIADITDTPPAEYYPTIGCRILEFDRTVSGESDEDASSGRASNNKASVELWDCSGNLNYENCWPAMAKDSNGVIFVFNPDDTGSEKKLKIWHQKFVANNNLKDRCCAVFAHKSQNSNQKTPRVSLTDREFSNVMVEYTNLDTEPEKLKEAFVRVLRNVVATYMSNQNKEELSIMNATR